MHRYNLYVEKYLGQVSFILTLGHILSMWHCRYSARLSVGSSKSAQYLVTFLDMAAEYAPNVHSDIIQDNVEYSVDLHSLAQSIRKY